MSGSPAEASTRGWAVRGPYLRAAIDLAYADEAGATVLRIKVLRLPM